jgi:HSP20 family protein
MGLFDLTPWRPSRSLSRAGGDPFADFRQQMDRLFEDFFGPVEGRALPESAAPALAPRLDVAETDNAYEISVELPGVEEKDLEVSVNDGVLSIKGEKRAESEEKKKNYHRIERSYGSFERRLQLPAEVDAEKIGADFSNGLLTVTVPKTEAAKAQARKIAIKSK